MTVGECWATIAATAVPQEPAPITATFGCRRSTAVTALPNRRAAHLLKADVSCPGVCNKIDQTAAEAQLIRDRPLLWHPA